ncbi:MAG: HNH endonuclease [Oligoflexus sp.]
MPPYNTADLLALCISGIDDPALALRLQNIKQHLVTTSLTYNELAQANELHKVPQIQDVGNVIRAELEELYTKQMGSSAGAARAVYDAIRNAPPNGKCPLCGIGNVKCLDHHLPKSRYTDLSICPHNLVPACDFCNKAKGMKYPTKEGEQTIHPYYDDFSQEQWVFANLDTAGSPVLIFFVAAPAHWPQMAKDRVQRHFDVVKLGESYTSNANDDLMTLRDYLEGIATSKGTSGVQSYLVEQQARYSKRVNSWQHVMYAALASNFWFYTGGFRAIPD